MLKVDTSPITTHSWPKVKTITSFLHLNSMNHSASSPKQNSTRNGLFKQQSLLQQRQQQQPKDDRLKIYIGTWNMFGKNPDIDLESFLTSQQSKNGNPLAANHPSRDYNKKVLVELDSTMNNEQISPFLDTSTAHPYHLLAIGTQECEREIYEALFYPSKEVWEQRLCEHLGDQYQLLRCETMAALHLAVFVWKPVASYVKNIHSADIKTGWANMVGNKGAVAVSLDFGTRSLLFINCHLSAHQSKLVERNANVYRILHELQIKGGKSPCVHPTNNLFKMPSLKRFVKSSRSAKAEDFEKVEIPTDHDNRASTKTSSKNYARPDIAKSSKNNIKTPTKTNRSVKDDKAPNESSWKNKTPSDSTEATATTKDIQIPTSVKTNKRIPTDPETTRKRTKKMNLGKRSSSAPSPLTEIQHNVTELFDHVFIFGDTNYRINAERQFVLDTIQKQDFETLLKYDQLTIERHQCTTPLATFKEHPINFIPTYKFDTLDTVVHPAHSVSSLPPSAPQTPSTATSSSSFVITPTNTLHSSTGISVRYDTSPKQRVPSWTDRILWHDRQPEERTTPSLPASGPTMTSISTSATQSKTKLNLKWISALTRKNKHATTTAEKEIVDKSTICYHYDTVMDPRLIGASDHLPVVGIFGVWFNDWELINRTKSIKSAKKRILPWKRWIP